MADSSTEKKRIEEKKELNTLDEWGLCANDEAVCPYCGEEQSDSWELSIDYGKMDCGDCFRPFLYEREVSVTYNTSPIFGPHRLSDIEQQWDAKAFPLEQP